MQYVGNSLSRASIVLVFKRLVIGYDSSLSESVRRTQGLSVPVMPGVFISSASGHDGCPRLSPHVLFEATRMATGSLRRSCARPSLTADSAIIIGVSLQ